MKSSGTIAKDYKQPTHIEYLHKLYKGNDEIVYFDRECVSNLIELLRSKGAK